MAKTIKKIKVCDHLDVEPAMLARLRCGRDRKEWVWNLEEKAYVCVLDPEKDKNLNVVGQLFK